MATGRVSHPKGAKTVLGRLKRLYGTPAKQSSEVEPVEQIVLAILSDSESLRKAQSVLRKLKSYYVDFNEMRVAQPSELAREIGSTFVHASTKAKRILAILQGIFDRENNFDLEFLKSNSKLEQEEYFRDIPGADKYLLASVILYCCKRQAFPLDKKMLEACKELELVRGEATLENMQVYFERQLRSSDSYSFCCLLKKYSTQKASKPKAKKKVKKKAASKKKSTSKKKVVRKKKTASKKKKSSKKKSTTSRLKSKK
jgi:endonuclease III